LGPIKESFTGIAEASGIAGSEMLKALQSGSGGLISNIDMMKTYNLAASLVSSQFANELPNAMEFVGKVSASTGEDMGFLMDSLVRGVGRLSPMILDNLGIQVDLNSAYATYAAELGKSASELTKTEQQTALMNQAMSMLADNTANLPELRNAFKQLSVTFTNLKDQVAGAIGPVLLPFVQDLADKFTEFVQGDEFQAWLAETVEKLEKNLIPWLKEAWKWIADEGVPAIKTFVSWVQEKLGPAILDFAGWVEKKLVPWLQEAWKWIQDDLIPAIQDLWARIKDFWSVAQPALQEFWRWVTEDAIPALREFWRTVEEFWNQHVKPVFETLRDWFTVKLPDGINRLKQIWDHDFLGIRTMVEAVIGRIENIFELFRQAQEGDWYGFGETLRTIWDNTWETIKTGASHALRDLGTLFLNLAQEAANKFFEINWFELGLDIIRGIISGIYHMGNDLAGAMYDVLEAALDIAKGFLGIESPSKVFADQVGKQIMAGIGVGMEQGMNGLGTCMGVVTNGMRGMELAGGAAGGYGGSGFTINMNFSKTVLTTTDVYELSDQLGSAIDMHLRGMGM